MLEPTDLTALLARVEGATEADRELDSDLVWLLFEESWPATYSRAVSDPFPHIVTLPEYTASLDASLALCSRVLPGWTVAGISTYDPYGGYSETEDYRLPYACIAGTPEEVSVPYNEPPEWERPSFEARAKTPALAVLTALLRAIQNGAGET